MQPSILGTITVIKFILRFKNETTSEQDDFIIMNSLKQAKLNNIFNNISAETCTILKYFKIKDYNREEDNLGIIASNNREKNDNVTENISDDLYTKINVEYREILMPVSMSLYKKVLLMSYDSHTPLTPAEIYNVLKYLFFMDNNRIIVGVLMKNFMEDLDIISHLFKINNGESKDAFIFKESALELTLGLTQDIFGTNYCCYFKDHYGNIVKALNSSERDTNKYLPIIINLNICCIDFSYDYLKMDYKILVRNDDHLVNLFRNNRSDKKLTVDIDFTGLFKRNMSQDTIKHRISTICQKNVKRTFSSVFCTEFLRNDAINKIVIRISDTKYPLNITYPINKQICIHYNRCILLNIQLPASLTEFHITNCEIEDNLIMPEHLDILIVKNVNISTRSKLSINKQCRRIIIENTRGNIDISSVEEICDFYFGIHWVELNFCKIGTTRLIVENAILMSDFCITDVQNITLKYISVLYNYSLTISDKCDSISLMNCDGNYCLPNIGKIMLLHMYKSKFEYMPISDSNLYKLNAESVKFYSNIELSRIVASVNLKHNIMQDNNMHIKIDDNCNDVILKNCQNINFSSSPIDLRVLDQCNTGYVFKYHKNGSNVKFYMKFDTQTEITTLKIYNITDIHLDNGKFLNNHLLTISPDYDAIYLKNCIGAVNVHNCIMNKETLTNLKEKNYTLEIKKNEEDQYNLSILGIIFFGINKIEIEAKSVYLTDVCVNIGESQLLLNKHCKILHMERCEGNIRTKEIKLLEKLCLYDISMFFILNYIQIPANNLIIDSTTLLFSTTIDKNVKTIEINNVDVRPGNILAITTSTCTSINITNSSGSFYIDVIASETTRDNLFIFKKNSVLFLRMSSLNNKSKLFMKHLKIEKNFVVKQGMYSIYFENITGNKTTEISINSDCLDLTVKSMKLKFDLTKAVDLAIIRQENMLLVPNSITLPSIRHLFLTNMKINNSVVLHANLKTVMCNNVTVSRKSFLTLNFDLKSIQILNCSGIFYLTEHHGLDRLLTCQKEQLIIKRNNNMQMMSLTSFSFVSNIVINDNIDTLKLSQMIAERDHKIVINNNCRRLYIESCTGHIDISNAKHLVFFEINKLFIAQKKVLSFFSSKWDKKYFCQHSKTTLPIICKTMCLRNINYTQNIILQPFIKDHEILLIYCTGLFDISKIKKLRAFAFVPKPKKDIKIAFPNLGYVEQLILCYNDNEKYFRTLLNCCTNLKILTVYSLGTMNEKYSFDDHEQSSQNSTGNDCLSAILKSYNKQNLALNIKMNELMKPMLEMKYFCTLKRLKLVGFCLNTENYKLLENFIHLKELSLDYVFVNNDLFDNLPPSLESLELTGNNSYYLNYSFDRCLCSRSLTSFMKHRNIRKFVVEDTFFTDKQNFKYLPENLEHLTVLYSGLTTSQTVSDKNKIELKTLTIRDSSILQKSFTKDTHAGILYDKMIFKCLERVRYPRIYSSILCYLSKNIDFSSLNEIIVDSEY